MPDNKTLDLSDNMPGTRSVHQVAIIARLIRSSLKIGIEGNFTPVPKADRRIELCSKKRQRVLMSLFLTIGEARTWKKTGFRMNGNGETGLSSASWYSGPSMDSSHQNQPVKFVYTPFTGAAKHAGSCSRLISCHFGLNSSARLT